MDDPDRIRAAGLPPGTVRRAGDWAVGNRGDDRYFAVSRRCRHQLADLAEGTVEAEGCLVCPWHQSRYSSFSGDVAPSGPRRGPRRRDAAAQRGRGTARGCGVVR